MPPDSQSSAADERTKILIVDDLAEKLLVYRSVLEAPGLDIIAAQSGTEALRQVLAHDFAVILLDVNMPDLDGFETASLIRRRKRCAHTPIIFITAFADELHALKGYSHGAVDYILSPVVPEVLRTKVRVFVDLFRKSNEIRRQGEILRELQAREHRRQLSETNQRLELALQAGRMGAWEWDLSSRLMNWSSTLEEIFGLGPGEFDGSTDQLRSLLHPEDRDHVLDTMEQAIQTAQEFCIEHRIVRRSNQPQSAISDVPPAKKNPTTFNPAEPQGQDGYEVAWVEVRGKLVTADLPERIVYEDGRTNTIGRRMMGVCMDITHRKQVEAELARSRSHLEDLVQARTVELERSVERLRQADRLASIGTLAAGLGHDMGNLLLPMRMRTEALQRMNLSAEAAEHINAIATCSEYLKRLSQGLRLFALNPDDEEPVPASARATATNPRSDDRGAVQLGDESTSVAGVGEPAADSTTGDPHLSPPSVAGPAGGSSNPTSTDVARLWKDVEPFLRNSMPRQVELCCVIDEGLPRIAMPAHRFTQMVYNLVLNAADAMRNAKPGGKVTINIHRCKASPGSSDDSQTTEMVQVEVQDQGVGMSDEVKARCMEPFFTTKTRGISTGLGLALVHGAVQKAGGTIELESRVGWGTRFVLTIPAVANEQSRAQPLRRILVCVQVRDIRMRAYVVSVLEPLQVDVITSMTGGAIGQGGSDAAELIVCDEREQVHIWQALEQRAETRAVILRSSSAGEVHVPPAFDHRVATWTQGNSSQLRDIVQQMIAAIRNRDAQESSERGEHVRLAEADRGHAGARSGQIGSAGGGASGLIVSHQLVG